MQKSKQWEFGPRSSHDVTSDIFPWKVSSFLTMLVSSCHCDPPRSTVHPLFCPRNHRQNPESHCRTCLPNQFCSECYVLLVFHRGIWPCFLDLYQDDSYSKWLQSTCCLKEPIHKNVKQTTISYLNTYSPEIHTKPLQWHVTQLFFCQPFCAFFPTKKNAKLSSLNFHSSAGRPKSKYTRTSQSWWRDEKMISWSPHGLNQQLLSHVEKKTNKTKQRDA